MGVLATSEAVRRIDQASIERFGLPGVALMESAGAAAARELLRRFPRSARRGVLVLCGRGNNGGDGFVVARHLAAAGIRVELLLAGATAKELAGDARAMADVWSRAGGAIGATTAEDTAARAERAAAACGVIVDALLGTGIREAPTGAIGAAIDAVARVRARARAARPKIVALDVPSGVDASTGEVPGAAIVADATVTFGLAKLGLESFPGARHAGRVVLVPLGWPRAALDAEPIADSRIEAEEMRRLLPPLDVEAHKGERGRVLIVAGRDDRPGAAALAAHAAFRAGAGLVIVATTERAATEVIAAVPEAMPELLAAKEGEIAGASAARVAALAENADAIVVGPGMGVGDGPAKVLQTLFRSGKPLVVDADALTILARLSGAGTAVDATVLTPHPGEAARLLGVTTAAIQSRRVRSARALAARGTVVLKGARSLVARPDGAIAVNHSGNPGLATAGAGDVLTGVIAALLARGLAPWDAARAGCWAHGAAADLAAIDLGGVGFVARDVADRVPRAFAGDRQPPARGGEAR